MPPILFPDLWFSIQLKELPRLQTSPEEAIRQRGLQESDRLSDWWRISSGLQVLSARRSSPQGQLQGH